MEFHAARGARCFTENQGVPTIAIEFIFLAHGARPRGTVKLMAVDNPNVVNYLLVTRDHVILIPFIIVEVLNRRRQFGWH